MILPIPNKTTLNNLKLHIYSSFQEVNAEHWDLIIQNKNIYSTIPYLSAIEKSLVDQIQFRYFIYYNSKLYPVAVGVVQFLNFIDKGFDDKEEVCRIRNSIKKKLLTEKGIQMMSCGTPFASGETGFFYSDTLTHKEAYKHLSHALLQIQKKEKSTPVILIKELFPESIEKRNILVQHKFNEFEIDVNMILKISPKWKNLNDYMDAMVTKFRTKARTAIRKSEELTIRNLTLSEIDSLKNKIESLYLQVQEKSSFWFGALNANSFLYLKQNIGEDFILKGYFLGNELIGFSSSFLFDSILDANYVGINYELNRDFAIYQRMLYDYIDLAIERGCKELRFGRTAEEIKSSVGAVPVPMKLFIRHKNPIANRILKAIVATIHPSSYELRKPFKQTDK
ncbi:MAG TPA: hypothetical protein PKC66_22955 [Leptospiraceae bacterium]|nr:hypothetical protein [Leptospiraceae bacterium]